jgi:hypothetical protein
MSDFKRYESLTKSCLVDWQNEIKKMRSCNWPYWKIAEWLELEKELNIHKDTIRKFCKRRNIKKGSSEPKVLKSGRPQSAPAHEPRQPALEGKEFEFLPEDEKPIHVH